MIRLTGLRPRYVKHTMLACSVMLGLASCREPSSSQKQPARPQSVVLLVTPKMFPDFDNPGPAALEFFKHYKPLTSHAAETIVVFAVGNSDHILSYPGLQFWSVEAEWARTTDFNPVSTRTLNYTQINGIIRAFRAAALSEKISVKVFDQIDSGGEFTVSNEFKYVRHPECAANDWGMYDIRGRMQDDHDHQYAGAPSGIESGTRCGDFLIDQLSVYLRDLQFDGIMYGNQLGTRGRWRAGEGPGYSDDEAAAIHAFFERSRQSLVGKGVMWFDSYNNTQVEHDTFSFPAGGYDFFDYLIASGFCVMTVGTPYTDNLASKLAIKGRPRILATLDYVDPWYTYNSMTDYAGCSLQLEETAIENRDAIDGVMFFANDETGALVPQKLIASFSSRFF